jgi:molecular chaperone HscB
MSLTTQAVSIQACKHCGAGAPSDAHFCPQCDKILTLARHGDYFSFLGLPRKLTIDLGDLDDRLRKMSRQFHPDYYHNATAVERLASLERSSYLNDAYRVLRNPVLRVEYLLRLEGLAPKTQREVAAQAPPELLEEVFEFNERIEEVRSAREAGAAADEIARRLAEARRPIERKAAEHESRLGTLARDWDAKLESAASAHERKATLDLLRGWFLEQTYIANLLAAIERELAEAAGNE